MISFTLIRIINVLTIVIFYFLKFSHLRLKQAAITETTIVLFYNNEQLC
jgi:hypothetical protein